MKELESRTEHGCQKRDPDSSARFGTDVKESHRRWVHRMICLYWCSTSTICAAQFAFHVQRLRKLLRSMVDYQLTVERELIYVNRLARFTNIDAINSHKIGTNLVQRT